MLNMSKLLLRFPVLLLVVLTSMTGTAQAIVEIDITKGNVEPLPIAIADFQSASPLRSIADGIVDIISSNLKNSRLFRPIEKAAFLQKTADINVTPKFEDWKLINAQALVTGRVMSTDGGQLKVECRLWDIFGAEQMIGQQFFVGSDNWRRVAHIISDMIYERLVGEKGYFDSRIVYVEETGPKNKRVKRLAIMDQDGANVKILTEGNNLVLTPRFSPERQEITYMSFEGGLPRVYLLQIETGQREIVGDFRGMTFAPRFSPDGKKIIMSLEKDGNANIYTMDLRSRRTIQLTDTVAIDTGPSYSPNGKRIVFESDRGGNQQLYVMNANGLNVQRISFGNGNYSTPVWSPRGDLIAFTKQSGGKFLIGVMKPDGSGERILTEGFHNEGPTWAPNGRVLMFFRDKPGVNGGPHLYSIDLTGYNERLVPTRSFSSDPAWSPLLK